MKWAVRFFPVSSDSQAIEGFLLELGLAVCSERLPSWAEVIKSWVLDPDPKGSKSASKVRWPVDKGWMTVGS